jgi:hypothetical protein
MMTAKFEATDESLMDSGTTDGDMPTGVYPKEGIIQIRQGGILDSP